jgi:hypothetical protein
LSTKSSEGTAAIFLSSIVEQSPSIGPILANEALRDGRNGRCFTTGPSGIVRLGKGIGGNGGRLESSGGAIMGR